MYLFYQPHACKSNIPSKTFCRQRYSGSTLEAVYLCAAITGLAQRGEHQMLSPAEMTVCLPPPGQVRATLCPSNNPRLALPDCLCPTGPLRALQSARVAPDDGRLFAALCHPWGSVNRHRKASLMYTRVQH